MKHKQVSTKRARRARKPKGRSQTVAESRRLEQMTIKLAPKVRGLILDEVHRRKRKRLPNASIQAFVTEAVQKLVAARK